MRACVSFAEHLSEDIAQALAQDVEYRMREIVQEGLKFASHSRRTRLTADDVNRSLRLLNVEVRLVASSLFFFFLSLLPSLVRESKCKGCTGTVRHL